MLRRTLMATLAAALIVAAAAPAHATTASRSVTLRDGVLPNDTTYSFYNPYTPAKAPTGNHLDLAKVTASYNTSDHTLMVDWVMSTPIARSNCPAVPNGTRCDVDLTLWQVNRATGNVDPYNAWMLEVSGLPFAGPAAQHLVSCGPDGSCDTLGVGAGVSVTKTETFGQHHVVWFRLKNWSQVQLRPGSEPTVGTFTTAHAAEINDPYWIDSKHDLATLIDWTDTQSSPDLLIG